MRKAILVALTMAFFACGVFATCFAFARNSEMCLSLVCLMVGILVLRRTIHDLPSTADAPHEEVIWPAHAEKPSAWIYRPRWPFKWPW